jgi:tetratricopeptide (TPR) repeat protein
LANRGSNASYNDRQKEADLNESLSLSRQLRDTIGEIEMLTRIYEIHFVAQKFDTVKKQLAHVTELENSIGFRHIHYNQYVLSWLDYATTQYGDAFSKLKLAIETMEKVHDMAFSNFFYGFMAVLYSRFDNYDKALEWLSRSLDHEPANKAKRIWYYQFCGITLNIARSKHPQPALDLALKIIRDYPPVTADNKFYVGLILANYYYALHKTDLSKKYFDMVLSVIDTIPDLPVENTQLFLAYMDLASFEMAMGRPKMTKKYAQKAKKFYDSTEINMAVRMHQIQ